LLDNVSFTVNTNDKIVLLAKNDMIKTTLFQIISGEMEPDSGSYTWGVTTSQSYLPKDNSAFFNNNDMNLVDWLRPYSPDQHDSFVRGFLGRMLFSGEEVMKKVKVLSGGEKQRCMLSKMMLSNSNVLIFDNPTDHLDLESITSLNKGLMNFKGTMIFSAHDHEFVQTIANRIIEITPNGIVDKSMTYDEYLQDENVKSRLADMY
ncbi:MAG: ATP-binding cassette domain-containing protein, partial [Fusobacteriaceae bacterium]